MEINPTPYILPEGASFSDFDYRKMPSFWCNNHPLTEKVNALKTQIPFTGKAEYPELEIFRLATNMYHDLYNNGGGNECRWEIKNELFANIDMAFDNLNPLIAKSLKTKFRDVLNTMKKSYFPKVESLTHGVMEDFMTDVVYYCYTVNAEASLGRRSMVYQETQAMASAIGTELGIHEYEPLYTLNSDNKDVSHAFKLAMAAQSVNYSVESIMEIVEEFEASIKQSKD